MEPMSPLDAVFLHTEDGITHMHIGSCAIFEGPAPSIDEVTALIESKLPLLTRYRQKVRFVPAGLGHPVWVDDQHFDVQYHVRHSALAPPGDQHDLENLIGRLMSQELDRQRPLWEAWMIEGFADGRWALISKVHHCMVDGIAGTDLIATLLDRDRSATIAAVEPWTPAAEPSDVRLAVDAAVRLATAPARMVLALRPSDLHPKQIQRRLGDAAAGLGSLAVRLIPQVRQLSVEGAIGANRRWAAARCSLDDLKAIGARFGGSVNDVVLAVISGAFRSVLTDRGESADGAVMRSLVPVSVRSVDDHRANNQVSLILADLPIGIADPVERLHATVEQMAALKQSHQVTAGELVVAAAGLVPPALLRIGLRSTMNALRRMPQRSVNTVTTNVPGPQYALYAVGREMIECLPFVPLSEGVRIGVAIFSYHGRIAFGVTGDYDTAPDVRFMASQIEAGVAELRRLAGHPAVARRTARHPRTVRTGPPPD
jgi:diacylglycerol O-acyltransferase / wax synthase